MSVGADNPEGRRRGSVGGVIGVTPRKGIVNLERVKAVEAVSAAPASET